jgi:hypothetical protein
MRGKYDDEASLAEYSYIPLIFTGSMWRELVEWADRYMLRPGFELASAEDMTIPRCVDTADEAIAIIREHHAQWLSRQVEAKV